MNPKLSALLLLPAIAVALTAPARAHAQSGVGSACDASPRATTGFFGIVVNGSCHDLSYLVSPTANPDVFSAVGTVNLGVGQVTVNALWDRDPFINFGASATNLIEGPVSYAFLFSTFIVPDTYRYATSSLGASLSAGSGPASITSPGSYPTYVSGYAALGAGSDVNLGVDLGTSTCTTTSTTTCNYGLTSNTFAPAQYNELRALLTWQQTGALSVSSFTGRVEILADAPATTVPEPSTYALMAAGLLATGAVARRRRA